VVAGGGDVFSVCDNKYMKWTTYEPLYGEKEAFSIHGMHIKAKR